MLPASEELVQNRVRHDRFLGRLAGVRRALWASQELARTTEPGSFIHLPTWGETQRRTVRGVADCSVGSWKHGLGAHIRVTDFAGSDTRRSRLRRMCMLETNPAVPERPMRILYIGVAILPMFALALWSGIIIVGLIRGECSKCPRCSATWIRPSRRRRVGESLLPRFIQLYRCDNCRRSFLTGRSTDYTA